MWRTNRKGIKKVKRERMERGSDRWKRPRKYWNMKRRESRRKGKFSALKYCGQLQVNYDRVFVYNLTRIKRMAKKRILKIKDTSKNTCLWEYHIT